MSVRALLLFVVGLMASGCARKEHRYAVKDLPAALRAEPWQAPCAVDLSVGAPRRQPARIEPGDTVEVVLANGFGSGEITRVTATVGEDGSVALPVVGRVPVVGGPPQAAGNAIVHACHEAGIEHPPFVQVTLQQPHQNRISVLGAVVHPGMHTLPRDGSDLVSALAAAGGLGRDAAGKIVVQHRATPHPKLISSGKVVTAEFQTSGDNNAGTTDEPVAIRQEFDLTSTALAKIPHADLGDGDVVFVERRDPPSVLVTGNVHRPGRYEFPVGQDFRILDAVAKAEGIPNRVVDTVVVCRHPPGQPETSVIQVSLHKATREPEENLRLMPGDIVSVEPTPGSLFKDSMKYIGTAASAGVGFLLRR